MKSSILPAALLCFASTLANAQLYPSVPLPSCVQSCIQTQSQGSIKNLCTSSFISSVHTCIPQLCGSNSTTYYTQIFDSFCTAISGTTASASVVTTTVYACGNTTSRSTTTSPIILPTYANTTRPLPTGTGIILGTVTTVYPSSSSSGPGSTNTPTYVMPSLTSQSSSSSATLVPLSTGAAGTLDRNMWSVIGGIGAGVVAILL